MSESAQTTLAEHAELILGFAFKSSGFSVAPPGLRLLRGDNVKRGRLEWGSSTRFWRDWRPDLDKYLLRPGDVVIGMDGSRVGENFAVVSPDDLPALLVQRVACLRGHESLDQRFLRYLVCNRVFTAYVKAVQTGTSIPHISGAQIGAYPIRLPPLPVQKTVADVLGALDEKIEAERRVADLALRTAEATYAHEVHEGERAVDLRGTGRWLSGGTPKTSCGDYWNGHMPWISSSSLRTFYLSTSDRKVTDLGLRNGTRAVPAGTVLFVVRGMSLKNEFRVGIAQRELSFGQDTKAIVPDASIGSATLGVALFAARETVLNLVDEAGHGTGRLATDRIERLVVRLPPIERAPAVEDALAALVRRGAEAEAEVRSLTDSRDFLLPKLLSGETSVRDAGAEVGSRR